MANTQQTFLRTRVMYQWSGSGLSPYAYDNIQVIVFAYTPESGSEDVYLTFGIKADHWNGVEQNVNIKIISTPNGGSPTTVTSTIGREDMSGSNATFDYCYILATKQNVIQTREGELFGLLTSFYINDTLIGQDSDNKEIYWETTPAPSIKLSTPTLTIDHQGNYFRYNTEIKFSWSKVGYPSDAGISFELKIGSNLIYTGTGTSTTKTYPASSVGTTYAAYLRVISSSSRYTASEWTTAQYFTILGTWKLLDSLSSTVYKYQASNNWSEGVYTPTNHSSTHNFLGWYTAASGGTRKYSWEATPPNDVDLVLYAQWQIKGYTISYNTKGAGTISPTQATYNSSDGKYHFTVTTQKPTIQGKSFIGWSSMEDSEQATYYSGQNYTTTSNLTLFAVYNSDKTITYHKRNGENGTPPAAQTVEYDASVPLDNGDWLTKTGYNLQHWQAGDGTGPTYGLGATYSDYNSLSLYGSWAPKNITITWGTAKNGPSVSYPASTYPRSLPFGSTFTLPNLPTLTGDESDQFSQKEWLVNGTTHPIGDSFEIDHESTYTIQGVYKKNTSWRGCFGERGGLWIYIGDDN